MNILIASINDIDELIRVEVKSKIHSFKDNEPSAVDHASRRHRWQTYFNGESPASAKPGRIVLKAVEGGRTIGYLAGHLTARHGKDAEIQSFYMLKEHQRMGTGTKLLQSF